MNIDPNIYAYTYKAEILCPEHVVERMIADGSASPAARDMGAEAALDQIAEANGIDRDVRDGFDSDEFPKALGAYDGLTGDDRCGECGEVLYA